MQFGIKRSKKIMILVVAAVAVAGCVGEENMPASAPAPTTAPTTAPVSAETPGDVSKKLLMVIAPENFRDEELFKPEKIFEDNGVMVTIASTSTGTAKGMLGATVKPDMALADVNMSEYDAIVIVGGGGSKDYLWENLELQHLVKDANARNRVVSAICISPVVLARAGVLEGRRCTVFPDPECVDELKEHGAVYVNRDVVVYDNIITGRDPKSAKSFARAVLDAI